MRSPTRSFVAILVAASTALVPLGAIAGTRASNSAVQLQPAWQGPAYSYASFLCVQQTSGCILPLPSEAAPVPTDAAPQPAIATEPTTTAVATEKARTPWLLILLGLGALVGGAFALGGGNDSNGAN